MAHGVAAKCLRLGFSAERYLNEEAVVDGFPFVAGDEMIQGVETYVAYCRNACRPGDEWEAESKVQATFDVWGTADFTRYRPSTGELLVVDFKFGRGIPVSPKHNMQALCYALGAVNRLHNRGLSSVTVTIVQPRCPHPDGAIREWVTDAITLLDFRGQIDAAVAAASRPDAPLKPGAHCKFCPAAALCPALKQMAHSSAKIDFAEDPPSVGAVTAYTPALLADALGVVDLVEDWCRAVRDFAHHELEARRAVPGYKLVANRATRRWVDETAAAKCLLSFGISEDRIFTRKIITPAAADKVMGKQNAIALFPLVEKRSSGTVVAPETDPRPAVSVSAAAEFMN